MINLKNVFLVEHNDQFKKMSVWLNIMINLKMSVWLNIMINSKNVCLVKHNDQFEKCLFG